MGYAMKGFGGFGNSPAKQTTDEAINDPASMYGPGKGKRLFEMSKKELQDLGFGPDKIKEIMADGAKNQMSQKEVLEDTNPRTKTAK
jgi:hypothetical protein